MTRGTINPGGKILALGLLGVLAFALFGCGGGGGSSADDTEDLYVLRFNFPNFSGIRLDEAVNWVFSSEILESSLNHDSIQLRTGDEGGEAPRGSFVKGIFLIDNSYPDLAKQGRRLVVDPGQLTVSEIQQAQSTGNASLIPERTRYDDPADDGFLAVAPGNRRILYDQTYGTVAMFVPDVPTRPDLSDTGYQPSSTYTVVLPPYPALNTVRNIDGKPLVAREGRPFVSTFTTVPLTVHQPFQGGDYWFAAPRVVNTDPVTGEVIAEVFRLGNGDIDYPATNSSLAPGAKYVIPDDRAPFGYLNGPDDPNIGDPGEEPIGVDMSIAIRFSQPLNPGAATIDNILLNDVSSPGEPQEPISLFLTQSREGKVEVLLTPLSPNGFELGKRYQVRVSTLIRDLLGHGLDQNPQQPGSQDFKFEFRTSGLPATPKDILETFETNSHEATGLTTANWNARFADQTGASPGDLVASFAPFAGNGTDGFFQPPLETVVLTTGETSSPTNYNFTSIDIRLGATVVGEGDLGLVMRSQGTVTIGGRLIVSGVAGGTGVNGSGDAPAAGRVVPGAWRSSGHPATSTVWTVSVRAPTAPADTAVTPATRSRTPIPMPRRSHVRVVVVVRTPPRAWMRTSPRPSLACRRTPAAGVEPSIPPSFLRRSASPSAASAERAAAEVVEKMTVPPEVPETV
jgi:hypothetical protein